LPLKEGLQMRPETEEWKEEKSWLSFAGLAGLFQQLWSFWFFLWCLSHFWHQMEMETRRKPFFCIKKVSLAVKTLTLLQLKQQGQKGEHKMSHLPDLFHPIKTENFMLTSLFKHIIGL